MTRIIRPIGAVSAALKRHGYRQQAAIIIDGKQLQHTAVLSIKVGDKIKYEGHFIDPKGELHKTKPLLDIKKTAARIISIRAQVLAQMPAQTANPAPATKQAAKRSAPRRKSAPKQRVTTPSTDEGSRLIDCKGCGCLHRDDTLCPW
jgi:hypothetical protein